MIYCAVCNQLTVVDKIHDHYVENHPEVVARVR